MCDLSEQFLWFDILRPFMNGVSENLPHVFSGVVVRKGSTGSPSMVKVRTKSPKGSSPPKLERKTPEKSPKIEKSQKTEKSPKQEKTPKMEKSPKLEKSTEPRKNRSHSWNITPLRKVKSNSEMENSEEKLQIKSNSKDPKKTSSEYHMDLDEYSGEILEKEKKENIFLEALLPWRTSEKFVGDSTEKNSEVQRRLSVPLHISLKASRSLLGFPVNKKNFTQEKHTEVEDAEHQANPETEILENKKEESIQAQIVENSVGKRFSGKFQQNLKNIIENFSHDKKGKITHYQSISESDAENEEDLIVCKKVENSEKNEQISAIQARSASVGEEPGKLKKKLK